MDDLQELIRRNDLRRELLEGVPLAEMDDGYDIDAGDELMSRAAEEIDTMQAEINALRKAVDAAKAEKED